MSSISKYKLSKHINSEKILAVVDWIMMLQTHLIAVLYKEPTRCNFGSIVY